MPRGSMGMLALLACITAATALQRAIEREGEVSAADGADSSGAEGKAGKRSEPRQKGRDDPRADERRPRFGGRSGRARKAGSRHRVLGSSSLEEAKKQRGLANFSAMTAVTEMWTLVFRQSFPHTYAANEWSKNSDNPRAENYAILDELENYRRGGQKGGFTFKLSWPGASIPDQVWFQTSNPVTSTMGGVAGYVPISVPFSASNWHGLEYNNQDALLDGEIGADGWHYAVGAMFAGEAGFPGPSDVVPQIELYVATQDVSYLGPSIFATRDDAQTACKRRGAHLCSRADIAGFAKCNVGWTSDWRGFWSHETVSGCGEAGYNEQSFGNGAGAFCCQKACPLGYSETTMKLSSQNEQVHPGISFLEDCATLCDQQLGCAGFEFKSETNECVSKQDFSTGEVHQDNGWTSCQKVCPTGYMDTPMALSDSDEFGIDDQVLSSRECGEICDQTTTGEACTDLVENWESASGATCADYAANKWCNAEGGYATGWLLSYGTFQSDASKGNLSAARACCACGGGLKGLTTVVDEPTELSTQGWSHTATYDSEDGKVHCCYGGGVTVSRTVSLPVHQKLRLQLRYWSGEMWDDEYGVVKVDGVEVFRKSRLYYSYCTGWNESVGKVPSWSAWPECFSDVDTLWIDHTKSSVKIEITSTLRGAYTEEYFAFNRVKLLVDAQTNTIVDETAEIAQSLWSSSHTSAIDGLAHGVFYSGVAVTRMVSFLPTHSNIRLSLRFFMASGWTNEEGVVRLNGVEVARMPLDTMKRCDKIGGTLWGGSESSQTEGCFFTVDSTWVPHSSNTAKIEVSTGLEDEGNNRFAFDNVKLVVDAKQSCAGYEWDQSNRQCRTKRSVEDTGNLQWMQTSCVKATHGDWVLDNMDVEGGVFKKTGEDKGYDASATLKHVTRLSFKAIDTMKHKRVGFTTNLRDSYRYSNGTWVGLYPDGRLFIPDRSDSTYSDNDVFLMQKEGSEIVLYQNSNPIHSWKAPPSGTPLHAKLWLYNEGSGLSVPQGAMIGNIPFYADQPDPATTAWGLSNGILSMTSWGSHDMGETRNGMLAMWTPMPLPPWTFAVKARLTGNSSMLIGGVTVYQGPDGSNGAFHFGPRTWDLDADGGVGFEELDPASFITTGNAKFDSSGSAFSWMWSKVSMGTDGTLTTSYRPAGPEKTPPTTGWRGRFSTTLSSDYKPDRIALIQKTGDDLFSKIEYTDASLKVAEIYETSMTCGQQAVNLGNLSTAAECAVAVLEEKQCGPQFMFSTLFASQWGCRCCTPGGAAGGSGNIHWDLYTAPGWQGQYYAAGLGASGCPRGEEINTSSECELAMGVLGLCHDSKWAGNDAAKPPFCSHRPSSCGSQDWHFNGMAEGYLGGGDLSPICRDTKANLLEQPTAVNRPRRQRRRHTPKRAPSPRGALVGDGGEPVPFLDVEFGPENYTVWREDWNCGAESSEGHLTSLQDETLLQCKEICANTSKPIMEFWTEPKAQEGQCRCRYECGGGYPTDTATGHHNKVWIVEGQAAVPATPTTHPTMAPKRAQGATEVDEDVPGGRTQQDSTHVETAPGVVNGYEKLDATDCGRKSPCQDNYLYIGDNGERYSMATSKQMVLPTCGKICDAYPTCGGFTYSDTTKVCTYLKDATCGITVASPERICYRNVGPPVGADGKRQMSAVAIGDPHITNVHGGQFDLHYHGLITLLLMPRDSEGNSTMLRVEGATKQAGLCAPQYIHLINITGQWPEAKKQGGYILKAAREYTDVDHPKHKRVQWFGPGVMLVISHGVTDTGVIYLNFRAQNLGSTDLSIGGLLGDKDGWDWATRKPSECENVEDAQKSRGPSGFSLGATL